MLWAIGSKETNLNRAYAEGQVHRDGHGWGLFGADDRWNTLDLPYFARDPEEQARLAARTLRANFRRLGNWLDAVNAYGPAAGRPAYGADVLDRAAFLAADAGEDSPVTPADIISLAMADPVLAGIEIVYVKGWRERGRPYVFRPQGCVIHHTATSRHAKGDYPSLGIVRDGRSDLPGPLSQFGLGRSGAVYVIAAGTSNHAGPGGWHGLSGNTTVWGIEAENDGIGEPWSADALDAYPRLVAALARHTPFGAEMVCCHREWSPYKIDPTGIDGDEFRARVAELLAGGSTPGPTPEEEVTMFIFDAPPERGGGVWQSDGVFRKPVRTGDTWPNVEGDPRTGRPAVAKHLGVASIGLFDDLIDIEAQLAGLRPAPVQGSDVEGLDPQAVADLVVSKLGNGLAAEVADLLARRLAS